MKNRFYVYAVEFCMWNPPMLKITVNGPQPMRQPKMSSPLEASRTIFLQKANRKVFGMRTMRQVICL